MNTKLYVGNLSFDTIENDLQDLFQAFGPVTEVNLIMDRATGRSRGFAFVTLSAPEDLSGVIRAMDGAMLDGRPLRVNEAQDRPRPGFPRAPMGGGGQAFGGGESHMPGGGGFGDRPRRKGSRRRNPRARW